MYEGQEETFETAGHPSNMRESLSVAQHINILGDLLGKVRMAKVEMLGRHEESLFTI